MELIIFQFLIVLFSVVIHEVSHGYIAERLGDPTARNEGRLTLNPLKHLDPIGSIALPALLAIFKLPVVGWAKPVPFDPRNLKNPKADAAKIALAGPASNLIVALFCGLLVRAFWGAPVSQLFALIVYINILLAIFNLIPIPPLDGSKILFALLPNSEGTYRLMAMLEQYGFIILLVLIMGGGLGFIQPIIELIYALFVGVRF